MDTEQTHQETRNSEKSPVQRGNFSDCGRFCDQNFYLQSPKGKKSPSNYQNLLKKKKPKPSTYGFSAVPRQKRGNFRFSICVPDAQFNYHPDHNYGKDKSPTWSFSKDEKYENKKVVQYEICPKHPLVKTQAQKMYSSTSSMKQTLKDQVKLMKSTSFQSTTHSHNRNYSIVNPRETSPVGFFTKTKIKNPFYLTRRQIMNGEQELQKKQRQKKQNVPCPEGYIQFYKKRARKQNKNMKAFEQFLPNYEHEQQFNNYSVKQHPTKPQFHIDMNKHLARKNLHPQRYGPNPVKPNIDPTRINESNIDVNTKKFRSKIRTRYDRIEEEPTTRLDYSIKEPELPGMVKMEKVIDRHQQLWPIVDPIIKKAGDAEMKESLKKSIPKHYGENIRRMKV